MTANVALTDTFDQWRVKSNELIVMTQSDGMNNIVKTLDTTNSTSNTTGSIITAGGVGITKSVTIGENLQVHGNVVVDGDTTISGNLVFGDADTDQVTFTADINSHIIPNANLSFNLGNTTMYWANTWTGHLTTEQKTDSAKPALTVSALDVDVMAVDINAGQTTANVVDIVAANTTTGTGLHMSMAGLTTGPALYIDSDSDSTGTRSIAKIIQNHASATGATALALQADAGRGLFIETTLAAGGYSLEIDATQAGTNTAKIASAATTGTVLDMQAEAITTGRGINYYDDSLTTGSALYIDSDSASTSTRSVATIIENNAAALAATALTVQSDGGITGMTLDKNFTDAAAATVTGLHVDFDRTVPGSGTANFTDIGINLDVNAAGLGTTTTTGLDIDVVGATSGTHTAVGLDVNVSGADTMYAAKFVGGDIVVGVDGTGHDVTFYGDTASQYMMWDQSADELILALDAKLSFWDAAGGENIIATSDGHLEVNAGTTLDITAPTVDINVATTLNVDGATQLTGAVTVGVDGTGHDVIFYGDTAGSNMTWDQSEDSLYFTDDTKIYIGDGNDMSLYHDGSNSYITNAVGALKIATETSGIAVTIGHTTSETTIGDNLTVTGTSDFTGAVTVGVNGTGHDVVFYGDTTGVNMTWDQSADALLIGGQTADAIAGITSPLQIEGIDSTSSAISIFRNSNDTSSPYVVLGKSRAGAVGGDTIVQNDDEVGAIVFAAADGVDRVSRVAEIRAMIGGTPGANDTPGELLFLTTADGAQASTERMRIMADGKIGIGIAAPASLLDVRGTMQVGVDGTGYDVKFFGATSGSYMLWDQSADELILADPAADATPLVLYNPLGTATTSRTVALDFSTGSADSPSNSHEPSGKILSGREGTYGASSTADSYMAFYTELNDTLAEKMRITSDGNVGIGVTSTTHTLLIKDSTAFVSGASNVANSAALQITSADGTGRGSMSIGGNDNVALFNPVSNALGLQAREYINFYCSNLNDDKVGTKTERMRITNGGLVGIGTTAPADQLHAIGTARINESTTLGQATNAGTAFEIRGDALAAGSTDVDAFKAFKIALNDGTEWGGQAQFSLGRWEESGSYARSSLVISLGHGGINSLTNADVDVMTLRSDGRVGIGITGPASLFHVNGTTANEATIRIQHQVAQAIDTGPDLEFWNAPLDASGYVYESGAIRLRKENSTSDNHDHYMTFDVRRNSPEAIVERMRITSAGKVGIGITSPGSKLQVGDFSYSGGGDWPGVGSTFTGNFNSTGATTQHDSGYQLSLSETSAVGIHKGGGIAFQAIYNSAGSAIATIAGIKGLRETATVNDLSGYLAFYTRPASGGSSEKLRIKSSGQVVPGGDATQSLGDPSYRWANLYVADMNFSNEGKEGGNEIDGTTGSWTLQEGDENIFIINNITGKKFKIKMEEI